MCHTHSWPQQLPSTLYCLLYNECVLLAWHVLGTCLPGAWQSIAKKHKASDEPRSSSWKIAWKCLSITWQVSTKHIPSEYHTVNQGVFCQVWLGWNGHLWVHYNPRQWLHGDECNTIMCVCFTTLTAELTDIESWILAYRSSGRICRSSSKVKVSRAKKKILGSQ